MREPRLPNAKKRAVMAMSGGVDSSVGAALLKQAGYEVIGITLCFNLPDPQTKRPGCCGLQGIEDARRVCHKLGIKHYVLNMQKALEEYVIKDFCAEYFRGRTPNPCIRCNQYIKFGCLLKKAFSLGAEFLATGHYARIIKTKNGYQLKKAKDSRKDQSYFLYRLKPAQLKHILFPLGGYTKIQVRALARKFGLPVADKLDSQEICFLLGMDYRKFLQARKDKPVKSGPVVDTRGNLLGEHKGIAFYTVGQRRNLRIAKGYPLYVTQIDPRHNKITVGRKNEALKKEFFIRQPHFILKPKAKNINLKTQIRYNHQEQLSRIELANHKIKISFKKAQFAVTPGQSAVFYDGDIVVGGGIIDKVLDPTS